MIFGVAAELGIALAAGDLKGAFVVGFDLAEFGFDDVFVDFFAVDDEGHGWWQGG